LFIFHAKFFQTLPAYKNGGRIHLEFPTLDPAKDTNRPLFPLTLGPTYKTGDEIGCWFENSPPGYILVDTTLSAGTQLRCRLIAS
jgi:hypothetical protein